MDDPVEIFLTIVILVVVGIVLMLIGFAFSSPVQVGEAVVINKSYTPAAVGTGVGPAIGGNGGVAVVTTYIGRSLAVLVRFNGEIVEAQATNLNDWAALKEGQKVKLFRKHFLLVTEWRVEP